MPVNKNAFLRYIVIDSVLLKRHASLRIIKEKIENELGEVISDKTIKNDIAILKSSIFKAPIEYLPRKGYYYANDNFSLMGEKLEKGELFTLQNAAELIEQFSGFEIAKKFRVLIERFSGLELDQKKTILIDKKNSRGIKNIDIIANNIRNATCISFNYMLHNEEKKNRIISVSPLVIKEIKGMWYLVAWANGLSEYRVYGLDRMSNIRITNDIKYISPAEFEPETFFKDSIGIWRYSDKDPEKILLRVKHPFMNYLIDNPWHPSQKIENQTSEFIEVSYFVYDCNELLGLILTWCNSITVISPQSLKDRLINHLKIGLELNQ
ncbi:MAG: WYL domain-containing protein [Bacteroidetes bacterium]|nr:WYL domain-containing protein [Bacteroidota bacterium]